jgi:hypothetical protein
MGLCLEKACKTGVAKRRVRKKRELRAEPLKVNVTLRPCARSLRGSLLGLKRVEARFIDSFRRLLKKISEVPLRLNDLNDLNHLNFSRGSRLV